MLLPSSTCIICIWQKITFTSFTQQINQKVIVDQKIKSLVLCTDINSFLIKIRCPSLWPKGFICSTSRLGRIPFSEQALIEWPPRRLISFSMGYGLPKLIIIVNLNTLLLLKKSFFTSSKLLSKSRKSSWTFCWSKVQEECHHFDQSGDHLWPVVHPQADLSHLHREESNYLHYAKTHSIQCLQIRIFSNLFSKVSMLIWITRALLTLFNCTLSNPTKCGRYSLILCITMNNIM